MFSSAPRMRAQQQPYDAQSRFGGITKTCLAQLMIRAESSFVHNAPPSILPQSRNTEVMQAETYSLLRNSIASTDAARMAGKEQANSAAIKSSSATAPKAE